MPDIVVKLPDGSEAYFPEGTSDDVMNKALAPYAKPEQSGLGYRAGQLGHGLAEGFSGLLDMVNDAPANAVNLIKAGAGMGAAGLNALTNGRYGVSPSDQAKNNSWFNTQEGITGTDNLNNANKLFRQEGIINDAYAPKDLLGRGINFTGNVIGGGGTLGPGGAKAAILPAISAFTGQEAAHQIAPDSQTAQILAGIGGGLIGGGPKLLQPTAGATASKILGDATPEQLAKATDLMKTGQVTAPEAIAYTTGNTVAPKIQRTLEGTTGGGSVLGPYMAQRTPQNAQTVADLADSISPNMAVRDPSRTADFVQQAAAQRIKDEASARTAAVKPFYDAAKSQDLNPTQVTDVAANMAKAAIDQGPNTKIGQMLMQRARQMMDGLNGGPETNIGRLDSLHDEMVTQANPGPFDPNQLSGKQSALLNQGASELQQALRTNPSYDAGQNAYAAISRNRVAPLQNSPVGQLAEIGVDKTPEGTFASVKNTLFPQKPTGAINADTLAYTANELKKTNPNAIPDMVRQHIQNTWDDSNKFIRGDTPQFSGARFAQTLAGNDQSAANLVSLVKGAAGDQAADGLTIALDRMKAQGTRLGEGSPTALNQETMGELSGGGLSQLTKPKAAVNDFVDRMRLSKNSKQLADMIVSPDGISKLQDISKTTRERIPAMLQRGVIVGTAASQPLADPSDQSVTNGQ